MDEGLSIVEAKAVLAYFSEKIPNINREVVKHVCQTALTRMQARIVSFEEQV